MEWIPIQYREFYDVPRIFVANYLGRTYLFDGSFDDAMDDYPPEYSVYSIPPQDEATLSGSWEGLRDQAIEFCGSVRVEEVRFDATRRAAIDSTSLDLLINARTVRKRVS